MLSIDTLAEGIPFPEDHFDVLDKRFWAFWSRRLTQDKTLRHSMSHGGAVWLSKASVEHLLATSGLTSHQISIDTLMSDFLSDDGTQENLIRVSVDLGNRIYSA
jgi:hypothetical protein